MSEGALASVFGAEAASDAWAAGFASAATKRLDHRRPLEIVVGRRAPSSAIDRSFGRIPESAG